MADRRLLMLVLLAIGGCGSDAADPPPTDSAPPPPAPSVPLAPAPAVSPDLERGFAILRRPRTERDRVPRAGREFLAPIADRPDRRGANPALARRVRRSRIWVVPGRSSVCLLYVHGRPGGGCAPNDQALAGSFTRSIGGALFGFELGRGMAYGLVPDGVRVVTPIDARGRALRRVRVVDNVWAVVGREGAVAEVVVDGRTFRVP